jgi:hypothetical protein
VLVLCWKSFTCASKNVEVGKSCAARVPCILGRAFTLTSQPRNMGVVAALGDREVATEAQTYRHRGARASALPQRPLPRTAARTIGFILFGGAVVARRPHLLPINGMCIARLCRPHLRPER